MKFTWKAVVASTALFALPVLAADELRLVSLTPASGGVSGTVAGVVMDPTNSVEATFEYNLESAESGRIGIFTSGVSGNPLHTGLETPIWVRKGKGQMKTRFSVICPMTTAPTPVAIANVRYVLFEQAQTGPVVKMLVEQFQRVDFKFCGGEPQTARPNLTSGGGRRTGAAGRPQTTDAVASDITIKRGGLTIGGTVGGAGGKFVGWGQTVQLTEQDSAMQSNGTCAFNISYIMQEAAAVATSPAFLNRFKVDGTNMVSTNSGQNLLASESKTVNTQAYLPAGTHKLVLFLDNDSNVTESDEGNNNFQINYTLSCGKP